jgi:hypothetical protein
VARREKPAPGRKTSGQLMGTFGHIADLKTDKTKRYLDKSRSSRTPGRINLKAVAEVLEEHGLNPTEEIVKLLRPIGDDGEVLPSKLDPDTRARVLLELQQYTAPKLKSVEIKGKIATAAFQVSPEQARAIAEEFLKSEAAGG